MSRRKYLTQTALDQDVKPPGVGECVARALGSRGGNIIEVEYPDGSQGLVLLPAKFHKKLWVKRGGYLIIERSKEAAADGSSRVTGTIKSVLYDEHVRQLKKMPGAWPPEFSYDRDLTAGCLDTSTSEQQGSESEQEEEEEEEQQQQQQSEDLDGALSDLRLLEKKNAADTAAAGGGGGPEPGQESSEEEQEDSDGLPPLVANSNRRVIVHEVSESESDEG